MSILSKVQAAAETAAPVANGAQTTKQRYNADGTPRENAKVWGNIGYVAPNGEFVSLPYGLALDTMNPATAKGQNPEWHKQVAAQNALLKHALSLVPNEGQTARMSLILEVRRVNDAIEVSADPGVNEYVADFSQFSVE